MPFEHICICICIFVAILAQAICAQAVFATLKTKAAPVLCCDAPPVDHRASLTGLCRPHA